MPPLPRLNVSLPNLAVVIRTVSGLVAFALLVAACGEADVAVETQPQEQQASSTARSSAATTDSGDAVTDDAPTSTASPAPEAETSDRPAAPDFTLALGDGGTYTLSEGEKPVYLIFWAEW